MQESIIGTEVHPADFATAARRHGRHFARYMFAQKFAANRVVLDAACGGGFGSAFLAQKASRVLGLDIDDELIKFAQGTFNIPVVEFRVHDLYQPISGGPFGLITSFETLEHVSEPHRVMKNLAAVLADDGTAIFSIPNGTKEIRDGDKKEYHKYHYSAVEFRNICNSYFAECEFYSQVYSRGVRHYLYKIGRISRHHAANYRFLPGLDESTKGWLAICHTPRI